MTVLETSAHSVFASPMLYMLGHIIYLWIPVVLLLKAY